ncbi:probable global transcription activator SNF2L2 isoform X2 [Daktulosphaira vitifoliae]|uniref:probable global transcription activator SNF2L2 isoform X2 n=1 Tax=Daktulosphaira vitifoliae TaxID=58002 RepID=UPI0021AA62EA|nr:probable global transcription activator SNF2L2 isoform X2 [Daktulosphaira vitifoliae]
MPATCSHLTISKQHESLMAQLLNILFKKNDPYNSWGFQVCGGRDSWRPLSIKHVQNETLAANYLNVGDRVLEIDGIDCYSLTESQAIAFLRRPSTCIEILILKRRGENVVPPKRSSSCKALQNFSFQNIKNQKSLSEPCSPPENYYENSPDPYANNHINTRRFSNNSDETLISLNKEDIQVQQKSQPLTQVQKTSTIFSNFRPRRNSFHKDFEQIRLRSRSNSPQFWKVHTDASPIIGSSSNCRNFWKKLEKSSIEDLSIRQTPSPVRPASVAFYPKTTEPMISPVKCDVSPKKRVTFSNVLLERNFLQMDLPDLSPGSKVDEEFNKIYNSAKQEDHHQVGATKSLGDMSAPPPPPPMPQFSGGTIQGGGPPPPPPMLHNGHIPAIRIKTELNEQPRELPSAIQNAMATKDKKPFTYLPGGLDLSEIKSPRMQRRLERNAQTPPSPDQTPQKSPEYHQQQQQQNPTQFQQQINPQQYHLPQPPPLPPLHQQPLLKPTFEQKPICNVLPPTEKICLLPQVQQPLLNKAPTPWLQKNVQPQQVQNFAPWAQNRKDDVDQVDRPLQERVIPLRVEPVRQPPLRPQLQHPVKNTSNSYDSEPIQGRSFKVLQQITQEPKGIYDGTQPYNSQALPLSELRKLNLSEDDRTFMNRVKSQVDDEQFLHNETDPRYRGASIPSRSFRILQTMTNSGPVPNSVQHSVPVTHYISEPVESKIYVPPSERPVGHEPHKYTGGSIPSRSFRMLQAMTGQNNEKEDENSRILSLAPYPYPSNEYWQHYKNFKKFHEQNIIENLQDLPSLSLDTHIPHALNTINEEESVVKSTDKFKDKEQSTETENKNRCVIKVKEENKRENEDVVDADCEVTVTITLPKKTALKKTEDKLNSNCNSSKSPVDFWQQINDESYTQDKETISECTSEKEQLKQNADYHVDVSDSESEESPNYLLLDVKDHLVPKLGSDDGDSGITSDISRQTSEKEMNGPKKYQRSCTHSRLMSFLQDDDVDEEQNTPTTYSTRVHTSGYSSMATTPNTPSVHNGYRTMKTEYEDYYKSWEFECPYEGYDIIPSKAFKAIQGVSVKTSAKFKCPKIPIDRQEN